MKNINEVIKQLESKFSQPEEDKFSMGSFIDDDDNDNNENDHTEEEHISENSDLVDLESRIRKPTPDSVTQKETPHQASGSESRTQYRSRAMYASPTPDDNNLNNYLSN